MEAKIGCATHIGAREVQQDAVGHFSDPAQQRYLVVLADGMGGHEQGAVAAQTVVDAAKLLWPTISATVDGHAFLLDLAQQAHRRMIAATEGQGHATMVALLVIGNQAWWAHAGDSRLYHFTATQPPARTEDHSLVEQLHQAGAIEEHQMANHPEQHILFQGLGGGAEPDPCTAQCTLEQRHYFVLCSDGFWGAIRSDEFPGLFKAHDLNTAARAWTTIAAQRHPKTSDNIAVALAEFTPEHNPS